jgi:predicted nuclease of predicted toxin-antitoxin system
MRLLFDENAPYSLARDLTGHECSSVIRLGWRGTGNGALLNRAEKAGFDVLVTLDDDMTPEQNMQGRKISILVLKPNEQGKAATRALAGRVLKALNDISSRRGSGYKPRPRFLTA